MSYIMSQRNPIPPTMPGNKGIIKMTDQLYRDCWADIYIFMKDFRPTHIEFRHWENDMWYLYGVSDKFAPLMEAQDVPFYDVVFTEHPDGRITYEFRRMG